MDRIRVRLLPPAFSDKLSPWRAPYGLVIYRPCEKTRRKMAAAMVEIAADTYRLDGRPWPTTGMEFEVAVSAVVRPDALRPNMTRAEIAAGLDDRLELVAPINV